MTFFIHELLCCEKRFFAKTYSTNVTKHFYLSVFRSVPFPLLSPSIFSFTHFLFEAFSSWYISTKSYRVFFFISFFIISRTSFLIVLPIVLQTKEEMSSIHITVTSHSIAYLVPIFISDLLYCWTVQSKNLGSVYHLIFTI